MVTGPDSWHFFWLGGHGWGAGNHYGSGWPKVELHMVGEAGLSSRIMRVIEKVQSSAD